VAPSAAARRARQARLGQPAVGRGEALRVAALARLARARLLPSRAVRPAAASRAAAVRDVLAPPVSRLAPVARPVVAQMPAASLASAAPVRADPLVAWGERTAAALELRRLPARPASERLAEAGKLAAAQPGRRQARTEGAPRGLRAPPVAHQTPAPQGVAALGAVRAAVGRSRVAPRAR
jgi:hypothetical protein